MSDKKDPRELVWEEPPPRPKRKGSKWDPIATALKSNPGQWAKVVNDDNIAIKKAAEKGELICFRPAGSFEGRAIVNDGRRWQGDVWLRYVGEHGEYADE
jgi:hypothetical protein